MLREQMITLLEQVDSEFDPPLSQRVSIASYVDKIIKHAAIFSLLDMGKLAGFVAMYCNDTASRVAYITKVVVAPGYRAIGIGSNLMNAAIEHARRCEYEKVELEVFRSNLKALNMYSKLGFTLAREGDRSVFLEFRIQSRA